MEGWAGEATPGIDDNAPKDAEGQTGRNLPDGNAGTVPT
jgi:hypothetical protein